MTDYQAFCEFMSLLHRRFDNISLKDALELWQETNLIFSSANYRTKRVESSIERVARENIEIRAFVENDKRIHAIKELRQVTGCSLKDAKDTIDRIYPH